jgi:tetratricopeptide (TPR) repeat protein
MVRPFHAKATEDAGRAREQLGDAPVHATRQQAAEGAQHVGTVRAASWVVLVAPADIVGQEQAEGVEVVGSEGLTDTIRQGAVVADNPGHLQIVPPQRTRRGTPTRMEPGCAVGGSPRLDRVSDGDLDEVLRLKRDGHLDRAIIAVEAVLGRHPSHPQALAQLADIQLRRGRLDEAGDALDRAEATTGTVANTARLRGDLAYRRKEWADAARCYQEAGVLGERSIWTLVQLGRARLRLGDVDGARGAAAQAVERDGSSSPAWVLLGDVERRQDRLEEAEARYATAHERAPGDQWAYAKLVEVRLLRLPPERREREMEVLVKTGGGDNPHLAGVLARLRSEQGDDQKAAEVWKDRASRHDDPYARKMHGFALRRAGRLDEAAGVLGQCVLEDPNDLVLFRTYVHLQHKRDKPDELRRTLEDLLPVAGSRRGAVYGELRKLPAPGDVPGPEAPRTGVAPITP